MSCCPRSSDKYRRIILLAYENQRLVRMAPVYPERKHMTPTKKLARFVVETKPEQIPDVVLHEARRCIINVIGVALHASQDPAVQIVLNVLRQEGSARKASVLGTSMGTSAQNAALANGFMAHLDDFDDTLFPTVFHPSAPTVPAALALAERDAMNGRDFVVACALGLEASCRLALAFQGIHHGAVWHVSGVIGGFGAAAAAGRLMGLDQGSMARAFGLAGTQASGLRETFGTMTKAFHAGRASQSGLLSALLAQRGFTSAETILEGKLGFAAAFTPHDHDMERITDELLNRWDLLANSPKPYACGILSHCMIDAMLSLRARPGVAPGQVRSITGRVNPLAIKLESRPEPTNGLLGRLSFQHAMAVALVDGTAYPTQFTDERVNDPTVAGLRRLIHVEGDESIGPDQCELSMTLNDGREYKHRIEHATGTPENPVTDALLEDKFRVMASRALPKARVDRLLKALWRLDTLDSVAEIARMCRIVTRKPARVSDRST